MLFQKIPIKTDLIYIYKIYCKDCDASYVEQTNKKLSTKIAEHRNYVNYNTQKCNRQLLTTELN